MKVNITGRGALNGIGILPVYNVEMNEAGIKRLLNFQNVRVFDANTGLLITKKTFAQPKKKPVVETQKIDIVTKVEPKVESVPVEIVSTPVIEETPTVIEPVEETVETTVVEEDTPVPVVEDAITETVVEDSVAETTDVDDTIDESVDDVVVADTTDSTQSAEETVVDEERKPYNNYHGRKNRNRRK